MSSAPGQPLFADAHLTEDVLMFDLADGSEPGVACVLDRVPLLRFPQDMVPLPNGSVLVGYFRSEGSSPVPADSQVPVGHGGLAEFIRSGELVRWASAGLPLDTALDCAVSPDGEVFVSTPAGVFVGFSLPSNLRSQS